MTDITPMHVDTPIEVDTPTPIEDSAAETGSAPPIAVQGEASPEIGDVAPQDPKTVMVRAGTTPTPLPPPLDDPPLVTEEQIRLTLAALQTAHDALPLDDDLYIPREVEANMVRRSLLNQNISRLRVEHQRFRELEPKRVLYRDWIATLQSCVEDLNAQLTEAVSAAANGVPGGVSPIRATQRVDNLKFALHDVAHGPDIVNGNEILFDSLAQWFTDHNVTPLPGEHGVFAGRGGLHSAKARHTETLRAMKLANAELERTLHAAQQLISGEAGRGYTVDPLTGVHPQVNP